MYTQADLMFFYTETSLHVGSGTSLGTFDLPVQREKYTNIPNAAGSGIKGALREWFENDYYTAKINDEGLVDIHVELKKETTDKSKLDVEKLTNYSNLTNYLDKYCLKNVLVTFGAEDGNDFGGAFTTTDARLLLFPVKSMKGIFAYITCPMVLSRLKRDMAIINKDFNIPFTSPNEDDVFLTKLDEVKGMKNSNLILTNKIILEEFALAVNDAFDCNDIAKWISENVIPSGDEYKFWRAKVMQSLVIVSDEVFKYFVEFSTEVQARIKLGEGGTTSGKGGNLFYEENIPADSLFYSIVMTSIPHTEDTPVDMKTPAGIMKYVKTLDGKRLRIGGDETIGKGITKIKFLGGNHE